MWMWIDVILAFWISHWKSKPIHLFIQQGSVQGMGHIAVDNTGQNPSPGMLTIHRTGGLLPDSVTNDNLLGRLSDFWHDRGPRHLIAPWRILCSLPQEKFMVTEQKEEEASLWVLLRDHVWPLQIWSLAQFLAYLADWMVWKKSDNGNDE